MPTEKQDREAIINRARQIDSAEEREAFLAQACGDDEELRRQIEKRIAAPAAGNGADETGREHPPTRIGPYHDLKKVGEGATGIVYQAEQHEPVPLTVALKVMKEGLDWERIVARFESERDALSLLDHPNIARVLGAGTRPSGQPYFILEWVEGVPLPTYCDEHQLPLKERLELFIAVCEAVQYAHQKGFIHGDLKPSNVLVRGEGEKPAPKVLDFGVTEAARRKPAEQGPAPALAGKPEYLSPDQADANVLDIDTRSDVYSLGVLLYELLTGTTPLPQKRMKNVSIREALRLIREEPTQPPSVRLDESKDDLASAAAKRQMKPAALVKAVRGDLDCLVMKALEKDRAHRYETAAELKRDVQRYLAGEPLEACPPTARRRVGRLMHEHPRLLWLAVVVALLLLAIGAGGVGVALWAWHKEGQARKAEQEANQKRKKAEESEEQYKSKLRLAEAARKATERERDQAQDAEQAARRAEDETKMVLTFLKDKLLSAGRPAGSSIAEAFWAGGVNKDVTLRKAADSAEPQVASAFADRPMAEASIREMLGLAYLNVGEPARAVKEYERAFALREARQGINAPDTADCRNKLAVAYRLAGRPDEAGRLFDRTPDSLAHAAALAVRGAMLLSQHKPAEAELRLRECLAIREKLQPDDWTVFAAKSLLGEALAEQKKFSEAEKLLRAGYLGLKERQDRIPASDKKRLTRGIERLIRLYEDSGKKDEAAQWRKQLEASKTSSEP